MERLLTLVCLCGCSAPVETSAAWIPSWSADWAFANHRISSLGLRPSERGVEATFVGGASTTGLVFDDGAVDGDDTTPVCLDTTTCFELPVADAGLLTAHRIEATSADISLVSHRISVQVPASGAEAVAEIPMPSGAGGSALAWLGGTFWASAAPGLPRPTSSCYDPRHGWLPTRMSVSLGEVQLSDGVARVPVSASFNTGLTYEAERSCLDAVVEEAVMALEVDIVVAMGPLDVTRTPVSQTMSWPDKGQAQSPDQVASAALPSGIHAWTSQAWTFHDVVEPGRGAYVRGLSVEAEDEGALGFSTNTSPAFTLKSGYDYTFAGEVLTLDGEWTVQSTEHADDEVPAALDDDGFPVWQELPKVP